MTGKRKKLLKRFKWNKRIWLNSAASPDTGAMMVDVEVNEYYTTASLQIRDCSRKVELDFSSRNKRELKSRLRKVDSMIEVLQAMKDKMEEGFEYQQVAFELLKEEQKEHPDIYTVIRGID